MGLQRKRNFHFLGGLQHHHKGTNHQISSLEQSLGPQSLAKSFQLSMAFMLKQNPYMG